MSSPRWFLKRLTLFLVTSAGDVHLCAKHSQQVINATELKLRSLPWAMETAATHPISNRKWAAKRWWQGGVGRGTAGLRCDTIWKTRLNTGQPCWEGSVRAPDTRCHCHRAPGSAASLQGLALAVLGIETSRSWGCKYSCPFPQPAFSAVDLDADWCPKREGRWFLEQPEGITCCRSALALCWSIPRDRYLCCSHRWQQGCKSLPLLQFHGCCSWRTTGQHPPPLSMPCIILWEGWEISFSHSSILLGYTFIIPLQSAKEIPLSSLILTQM